MKPRKIQILSALLGLLLNNTGSAQAQKTPFERSGGKETATYEEAISYYENLVSKHAEAKLLTYGTTDFGMPLRLLVLSRDKTFSPDLIRKNGKTVLLINNGIHPGEPEGIDASMMLARDLLSHKRLPKNVVICILPVYNIDGSFNRSGTSRANQNGPLAYGFRGNSKNLDLNRDFIKTDSENSRSFQEIFNLWQPEVFVDTHTSNGADYQYVMTLIPSQKDKLNPVLSEYMTKSMIPALYTAMEKSGYPLIPYVNSVSETPEEGITGFLESPRYSTGYAALHNCIGFMPETHMLKPYEQRVDATYKLLQHYVDLVSKDAELIFKNKRRADRETISQQQFPLEWVLDQNSSDEIEFKGYAAKYKKSEISGFDRLYYDREEPYTTFIKEWNDYKPSLQVDKPMAYLIPKAWEKVISLLKLNGIRLRQLSRDTVIEAEMYYIEDYKTVSKPFEGHYLHSAVKLKTVSQPMHFYQGDYVAFTDQPGNRYLIETLEPQATDSFFNWNFFDAVLGMKEHFSAYVFEDTGAQLLANNPDLRTKLEEKKNKEPEFRENAQAQLDFIYKNSEYYEKSHSRFPIARLTNKNASLNLK